MANLGVSELRFLEIRRKEALAEAKISGRTQNIRFYRKKGRWSYEIL